MQKLISLVNQSSKIVFKTFKRFPIALIGSSLLAIILIITISESASFYKLYNLNTVLLFSIPLFIAIELYNETSLKKSRQLRVLTNLLGLIIMGIIYFTMPDRGSRAFISQSLQILLAFHLCVAIAPQFKSHSDNGVWQFNRTLFINFLVSTLYAVALFLGLILITVSFNYLFNIKYPDYLAFQLWMLVAFIFHPTYFLSLLTNDIQEIENSSEFPDLLKNLVKSVLIPVVSIYTLILFAYLLKLVIDGNHAKNLISWLICIMSVLGILNLLLVDPLTKNKYSTFFTKYKNIFYLSLLPLALFLSYFSISRFTLYGFTEYRYLLLLISFWLIGISLYYILDKAPKLRTIPFTLLILTLITFKGPLAPDFIAKRSQLGELNELFNKHQLYKNYQFHSKNYDNLLRREKTRVRSIISYIMKNYGIETFSKYFKTKQEFDDVKKSSKGYSYSYGSAYSKYNSSKFMDSIGFKSNFQTSRYTHDQPNKPDQKFIQTNLVQFETNTLKVSGYDYVVTYLQTGNSRYKSIDDIDLQVQSLNEPNEIQLLDNKKIIFSIKKSELIERMKKLASNSKNKVIYKSDYLNQKKPHYQFKYKNKRFDLTFNNFTLKTLESDPRENEEIHSFTFFVLVKNL